MATDTSNSFPPDFVWGAATASYQIEGATHADGRGESVWDRFSATPGKVRGGDTGEIACDFYHRYGDDVQLMHDLGLDAFRFSIAWPRILPDGRGRVNAAGLDFYDRLVDALLAQGIEPFATLFHWDTPQALEDAGGWPVRETAEAFVEYAEAVVARLGDRVRHWTTHNEPWVHAWIGHSWGWHAPGRTSEQDAVVAAHHLLLSHGWATEAIRRAVPDAQVGIVLDLSHVYPATSSPEDEAAAWAVDGEGNRWFLDAVFRGAYPADLLARNELLAHFVSDGDLATISTPIDFLGVNNYRRFLVTAGADGPRLITNPEAQHTEMGWEVYPDGLHQLLVRVANDYSPTAIYVTENGAAFGDVRVHDGKVHDPERTEYLESHIGAVARAIADGAPVKGYFVWSLFDNFEWAMGYSKRFGLVYVDYPTLERVPKDSFYWYRDFIGSRRDAPKPAPVSTG
ncbi:MAG TPA: GH1 family beta-glucosidase [Gaiellaceae bacterium]|nr:GH1 family beta-glucosidase [Gaiellaceae bacterium]